MKVDDTLTLSCSASCDLQPTISRLFNGFPSLPQGAAIEISNDLIVLSANHTHGGTYPCSASNLLSSIYANVIVYVEYPETCSVVKTNISEENGDYVIDPDGAQGENPFPVCCDMISQGGVGVTVVSHNSESRTHESNSLRRRANARNVSFRISSRWLTYIVNSVDKTKLSS